MRDIQKLKHTAEAPMCVLPYDCDISPTVFQEKIGVTLLVAAPSDTNSSDATVYLKRTSAFGASLRSPVYVLRNIYVLFDLHTRRFYTAADSVYANTRFASVI